MQSRLQWRVRDQLIVIEIKESRALPGKIQNWLVEKMFTKVLGTVAADLIECVVLPHTGSRVGSTVADSLYKCLITVYGHSL